MNSFVFNSRVSGFYQISHELEEPSIFQTYMNDSDMRFCSTLGVGVRPGNAEELFLQMSHQMKLVARKGGNRVEQ
jgi:hypothetical protein